MWLGTIIQSKGTIVSEKFKFLEPTAQSQYSQNNILKD